jgi:hypothetical protein
MAENSITADQLNTHLGGAFAGQGQAFIDAANRYGIDPVLLASISMFETGNGTSHMVQTKNNPAGIWDSKAGAYRTFSSLDDGLDFTARNLKTNYINQGLTTPEQIGPKYAPPGASNDPNNTNASWPANVRANMVKLGGATSSVAGQVANVPQGTSTTGVSASAPLATPATTVPDAQTQALQAQLAAAMASTSQPPAQTPSAATPAQGSVQNPMSLLSYGMSPQILAAILQAKKQQQGQAIQSALSSGGNLVSAIGQMRAQNALANQVPNWPTTQLDPFAPGAALGYTT